MSDASACPCCAFVPIHLRGKSAKHETTLSRRTKRKCEEVSQTTPFHWDWNQTSSTNFLAPIPGLAKVGGIAFSVKMSLQARLSEMALNRKATTLPCTTLRNLVSTKFCKTQCLIWDWLLGLWGTSAKRQDNTPLTLNKRGKKIKQQKNAFGDHCTYWQGSNVLACTCNIEPLGLCSTVLSISDKKSYTVVVTINPFPGGGPMFWKKGDMGTVAICPVDRKVALKQNSMCVLSKNICTK